MDHVLRKVPFAHIKLPRNKAIQGLNEVFLQTGNTISNYHLCTQGLHSTIAVGKVDWTVVENRGGLPVPHRNTCKTLRNPFSGESNMQDVSPELNE